MTRVAKERDNAKVFAVCDFCAKIEPKIEKIWKTIRKQAFFDDWWFWQFFLNLLNFGTILAQKLNRFICKKKIGYFDTQAIPEAVK